MLPGFRVPTSLEYFSSLVASDEQFPLLEAAASLAMDEYPDLDVQQVPGLIDQLSARLRRRVHATADTAQRFERLNRFFYRDLGFSGNLNHYHDPENSYLDRVVERRRGIPITLSLVYMEVAERVGLRCDGVGFPGHFLVRCGEPSQNLYIDPFHGGSRVSREALLARLAGADLGGASPESFLAGVTRRQIVQRMLNNLHALFRERRDLERWLATVELLLRLEPWNGQLVGERGMLHYRLGAPERALVDLERYVGAANPGAVSSGALRLLDELRLLHKGREGTA